MRVLGIETSCDDTAVCLIEASGKFGPEFKFRVFGTALSSQAPLHAEYGGVFPNLAKREHAKNLVPLSASVLKDAGELKIARRKWQGLPLPNVPEILEREPELLARLVPFLEQHEKPNVDAIAVTAGPGLEPALWVGVNFARVLSSAWNIPIVAVNHMEGHVIVSMMEIRSPSLSGKLAVFEFPALALLISGGHTELVLSKAFAEYELIGKTRDDAAGEAFDKVARMLDLPYPGGPEISRLAREAREAALPRACKLPRPMMREDNFDFSFAGLKTAVLRIVENKKLSDIEKRGIAREFEDAVADVLIAKTTRAFEQFGASTIIAGGGVSANAEIRRRLAQALAQVDSTAKLLVPPPELATDNAIMIALAGYFHALKKEFTDPEALKADGNAKLGSVIR